MNHPRRRYILTNFFIYSHVFLFLIPWQPVPYKPTWLGPINAWIFLFLCLSTAFCVEVLLIGTIRRVSFFLGFVLFWFVVINIMGITAGFLNINPVRRHIPVLIQIARAIPLADGLLIYYLLIRNNWGIKEYEKLFFLFLIPGMMIAVESFLIFYLQLPLGIEQYSLREHGKVHWFVSVFIVHATFPGPIGILVAGISYYFYTRFRKPIYLVCCIFGILLVISSVTLSAYLSLVAGMGFVFIYWLKVRATRRNQALLISITLISPFMIIMSLIMIIYIGSQYRSNLSSLENLKEKIHRRSYQIVRSCDVLVNYPIFGAGPGIGYYYAYSKYTEPIVSSALSDIIPPRFQASDIDEYQDDPYHGIHYSLHSVFTNFIIDLGIMGLLLFLYMIYRGMIILYGLFFKTGSARYDRSLLLSFSALMAMLLALCIFISAKPKFYPFWLFAILLSFSGYMHKNILRISRH